MTARKKPPPPPWLDLSTPLNDRARTQRCPRCHHPVIRALVGNPCGVDVRADPQALDLAQELAVRLAGRFTYCLAAGAWGPARLIHRGAEHIASGRCRHLVIADHQCPATPATPSQMPSHPQPPSNQHLFDL